MTHDELLSIIQNSYSGIPDFEGNWKANQALREIAILHQPQSIELLSGETISTYCFECDDFDYPCSTIYIIEKVLK